MHKYKYFIENSSFKNFEIRKYPFLALKFKNKNKWKTSNLNKIIQISFWHTKSTSSLNILRLLRNINLWIKTSFKKNRRFFSSLPIQWQETNSWAVKDRLRGYPIASWSLALEVGHLEKVLFQGLHDTMFRQRGANMVANWFLH